MTPVILTAALPLAHAGELVALQGQSIAPVDYETPEPVATAVSAFAAELGIPFAVRAGAYLVPGASYRLEHPRFLDPPGDIPPVPRLHEAELMVTGRCELGAGWSGMGQLAGGLAGDLEAIDRAVVRLSGFGLAAREVSEDLQVGFGGALTWAFGQATPVPLLLVDWSPSEALRIEAVLPARASAIWSASDRWRLGGFAELVGNEYAVRHPDIAQGDACASSDPAEQAECIDHLAYTDGNGGGLLGLRLAADVWLEARAGASVYRRFALFNADNEPVSFGEQQLSPAPLVKVRLTYEY